MSNNEPAPVGEEGGDSEFVVSPGKLSYVWHMKLI